MQSEPRNVFISHAREDLAAAREVERILGALELTGWRDQERVYAGPQWPQAIGEVISANDLLLLLWSKSAFESHFVEFEWTTAIALNKTIVPCLLDDTPLAPSLASFDAVEMDRLRERLTEILPKARAARDGEATQEPESILRKLQDVAPSDTESMATAGIMMMRQLVAASGEETATMVGAQAPKAKPANDDPAGLEIGKRYEIIKLLGEGGMGTVYQARDKELDREVALKLVKAEMAENPMILQRFKREIQLSSIVTHPNVLRVYDLGEDERIKFLTMQFVDGEDLTQIMERDRLKLDRVLSIFGQVCEGLKAAHDKGILHRDLKPANIMIDKAGHVFLTDFGLARSDTQETALTQVGELMGTPHYMSPEQVKGEQLDTRSDIYSLGVILYEMATGKQPYVGDTIYEVMIQRTQKAPDAATSLNPDIRPFLEHIIRRCMARDKDARYADLGEVLVDLNRGIETGKTSFSGRFHLRWLRGMTQSLGWGKLAIIGALLLVVVAGGVWTVRNVRLTGTSQVAAPQEPISVLIADFANMTGDPVFDGTLEQALSIGLEGASFVEAFKREKARSIATGLKPDTTRLDRDVARLVAQREGVGVVVTGNIDSSGGSYSISIEAIEPFSGDSLTRQQALADAKEGVLQAVGQLAIETRKALGDAASEAELRASVESFTSSSLEASEAYARGQALQQRGKWQEGISRYQTAIQLDANMGRAYSGLAVMSLNLGQVDEAEKYYLMAMSQLDRMTPRERYRTRGGYYIVIRDYEKAVEEYSALVEEVPGDSLGRANLAYAASLARDFEGAYSQMARVVEADPKHVVKRANLAWYAMIANDFEAAAKQARQTLNLDASFKQTYIYLALIELAMGRVEPARETWEQLAQLGPAGASLAAGGLADLASYQGEFREAVALLQDDLETEDPSLPAIKRAALAVAHLELGEKAAAVRSADEAMERSQRLAVVFEAALVHLRAGDRDRGLDLAAQLTKSRQVEDQAYGGLLRGESHFIDGNYQEAIRLLREAQRLADTWLGRLFLGRAYLAAEAFPEAYSEFEQCLARRGEATSLFLDEVPTYRYFPAVHYYMGRAQEGLQSPAAADSFRAYLEIRNGGEPDERLDEARAKAASE